MTIATSANQISYAGDGVSLAFAFPYPFITTADLKVYVAGVLQSTGYSVAGVAPVTGSGTFASGTVTFVAAPSATAVVLIYCDPDLLQSTSLPPNDPFPSKTVEKMVDKLTLLIQRIYSKFGNAITFPPGDTASGVLPSSVNRALKLLGFDAAGNVAVLAQLPAASFTTGNAFVDQFAGTGAQTAFALSSNPGTQANLDVMVGGVTQRNGIDFTWVSGTTLTFATAPPLGVAIQARYTNALALGTNDTANISYYPPGTGIVPRTLQGKMRESISVLDYLAVGDGVTDDAAAFMRAYAAAFQFGLELQIAAPPSGAFALSTVTFDQFSVRVRFMGNGRLKGIASSPTAAVVELTGRQMVGYDWQVDGNFNANYTKGNIWWHSVSAGLPAQYNRIFGLINSNCVNGIVFGDVVGGTPVDAPQSENLVDGYFQRACQNPFVGNQPNGFITFSGTVFDCNPNEWSTQPGYNAVTFATNATLIRNPSTGGNAAVHITTVGGEFAKTYSTLGFGIVGGAITINSPNAIEIAGIQGYIDNYLVITDCPSSSMTCGGVTNSSLNAWVMDPAAPALGFMHFRNYSINRPVTSSANSTASFIAAASGSPAMPVEIIDCKLVEWRWDSTVPLTTGVILQEFRNTFVTVNTRGANTLVNQTPLVVTASTFTVQGTDLEVIVNFAGISTGTLPAAASYKGKYLRLITLTANTVVSASSNVIPLGGTSAGTAILAATAGKWAEAQSDGTNWRILRAN